MREFSETTLELNYQMIEKGVSKSENVYLMNRLAPRSYPYLVPVYDFSREALYQGQHRGIYYLMFASCYGAYYYMYISPHSMYLMISSALSLFFGIGFTNYQMIMFLSVADM